MRSGNQEPVGETRGPLVSRRHAVASMLGAGGWLQAAENSGAAGPLRLAISESLVTDVNLNDARAAMSIWIKIMSQELSIVVEISPKVFESGPEILRRARQGQLDAVALNIIEYRQIAEVLDPTQIVAMANEAAMERYVLLAKRSSGIQRLADLRGRRMCALKGARMCVADAWLATLLDAGSLGPVEEWFRSLTTDTKVSRVILPVFFGQADACLASKRGFDTMCDLNPQVARDLTTLAASPPLVPTFYAFHRNYQGRDRDRFARVYSNMGNSAAGRQLATLFQFDTLIPRDVSCLASALRILDAAERIQGRRGAGSRP